MGGAVAELDLDPAAMAEVKPSRSPIWSMCPTA
jgi:hypothetical protein